VLSPSLWQVLVCDPQFQTMCQHCSRKKSHRNISRRWQQLDGVIESVRLQRVLPLADPPIASYSELVAAWSWIGRSSQVRN
jgi:hypothetical protein